MQAGLGRSKKIFSISKIPINYITIIKYTRAQYILTDLLIYLHKVCCKRYTSTVVRSLLQKEHQIPPFNNFLFSLYSSILAWNSLKELKRHNKRVSYFLSLSVKKQLCTSSKFSTFYTSQYAVVSAYLYVHFVQLHWSMSLEKLDDNNNHDGFYLWPNRSCAFV